MTVRKRDVDEYIGRLQKQEGVSTVSVCADCVHGSAGRKRSKWVCLARPIRRDIVDGEWLYTRCDAANDGDCTLFVAKEEPKPEKQCSSEHESRSWWPLARRQSA